MQEHAHLPKLSAEPIHALFPDALSARTAIETMLQGGFHGEQLGLLRAGDSVLSAANDLATYRATGLSGSRSPQDHLAATPDPLSQDERERELAILREHAVIVTVAPGEGQERNAREMLTSLGGKLLRADGSLDSQAA